MIYRADDTEEKWVVAPAGVNFTREEIAALTDFQEKYFDSSMETYEGECSLFRYYVKKTIQWRGL